jgi:hypothetical protein
MTAESLLTSLAGTALRVVSPLATALGASNTASAFLADFGWQLALTDDQVSQVRGGLAVLGDLQAVTQALSELDSDPDGIDPVAAAQLVTSARALIGGLADGISAATSHILPDDAVTQISAEIADYLIIKYLHQFQPGPAALLTGFGVIEATAVTPTGDDRIPYIRRSVHWERLPTLFTNPAAVLAAAFGQGGALDAGQLLAQLGEVASLFGLPSSGGAADPSIAAALNSGADTSAIQQLVIPLAADVDDSGVSQPILSLLLAASSDAVAAGVRLDGDPASIPAIFGPIGISLDDGFAASLALIVILRQGQRALAGSVSSGTLTLSRSSAPPVVLGPLISTHLIVEKTSLTISASQGGAGGRVAVGLVLSIDAATLTVDLDAGDSFLSNLLGDLERQVDLSLAFDWSSDQGLRIRGGAGLRVDIPLSQPWGPVKLAVISVAISISGSVGIAATVSGGAALGPFAVTINGIGVQVALSPADDGRSGILGGLDLACRFQPPTGIGLSLQTPAVSGGGFLLFDEAAGRYAGVFELTIVGTVSVKAIALITTKLSNGTDGFALLIIITAEGFTPIQLGMGFTLTGIGGLLAINHTVDADAVRGGLSNGVLDSILFVKDPVKNANRILATLDQVFPPAPDRLLIGPLAEISWGTPQLVKIRLALLLEVPQPIRVVLLAALSMVLPRPDDAVVEIHIDSIGVLDFAKRELALDASLHDSRILQFTLTGDMALRLNWGDEPMFVLSIGGFHPKFTPPIGLRPLNRLALTLTSSDNPRVRFEAYLALTSNTIQMGARVDVHFVEGAFALDGGGSFDALIQWSPFALDVALALWVRITSGGSALLAASVAVEVTGPRPWHLTGQASVQILGVKASVGVDFTFGTAPDAPEVIEMVDVAAEIWAQLSDPARWEAMLPVAATPGVTLAGLPVASDTAPLVAHPLATVSCRQQIAPLSTPIERVGGQLPVGGTRSYTASVSVPPGVAGGTVTDMFAPGQYANLTDDARLAGPSFAAMPAGVSLTPQTAASAGPGLSWDLTVQTLDVTSLDAPATPGTWVAAAAETARGPVPALPPTGQVTT